MIKIKNEIKKIKVVLICVILYVVWALLTTRGYKFLFPNPDEIIIQPVFSLTVFLSSCLYAPIWEECLFRYIPLSSMNKIRGGDKLTVEIVLLTSIIFGWLHGSIYNIAIQGVAGLLFSYVYLYTNSYKYTVLTHMLCNVCLYLISIYIF